jgi:outer membrane protein TolC
MIKFLFVYLWVWLVAWHVQAQTTGSQMVIASFDELLDYTTTRSLTLKNTGIQLMQAKKARLAAIYGVLDPTGNVTGSYTNNTRLPVTLFPSEILGGQPGTFREIPLGVQYVSNGNAYAEIKLFNLSGWENLRLSRLNLQTVESDNKVSAKNLYQDIASVYFNILTLQEQLKITELNLRAADTLYQTTLNRYNLGQAKQQDVNESQASRLKTEETIRQIHFDIERQYAALKILCDIPERENLQINQQIALEAAADSINVEASPLTRDNAVRKERFALANYRRYQYSFFPTVSFFASYTTQQFNTGPTLFDNNVNWIPSNYIGLKVTLSLPTAHAVTQSSQAKYEYLQTRNNTKQARIKSELDARQLQVDYQKAVSQLKNKQKIYNLRRDTYQKNLLNYNAGISSLDQTINSFDAMVNSNYDLIASSIRVLLAQATINIHTKIR